MKNAIKNRTEIIISGIKRNLNAKKHTKNTRHSVNTGRNKYHNIHISIPRYV